MPPLSTPDHPSRRGMLAGAAALALAPGAAHAAAAPRALAFEALRNGRRIGRQTLRFEAGGDGLLVHTVAAFAVKLGPIVLYRYRHEARERWAGTRFVSLRTRTDQNGRVLNVSAERDGAAVAILAADGRRLRAPATALPFSHWNRAIAGRPLFNPQDGRLLEVTAAPPEPASVRLASGERIPATRIAFSGDAEIADFYDRDGVWAGLVGKLEDGSAMEYRRL